MEYGDPKSDAEILRSAIKGKTKDEDKIIKTNEQIIENNISILTNIDEELNFENIFDYRIDEIYIRIIIGLIKWSFSRSSCCFILSTS